MQKKSVSLSGHRTSILLEAEFWAELKFFAAKDGLSLPALIAQVDEARLLENDTPNLASALRLYVLKRIKEKSL